MFLAGLVVSSAVGSTTMPAATTRPNITRLGTWDLGLVETTPINVKGRLLLYVNSAEQPCSQGAGAAHREGAKDAIPTVEDITGGQQLRPPVRRPLMTTGQVGTGDSILPEGRQTARAVLEPLFHRVGLS